MLNRFCRWNVKIPRSRRLALIFILIFLAFGSLPRAGDQLSRLESGLLRIGKQLDHLRHL